MAFRYELDINFPTRKLPYQKFLCCDFGGKGSKPVTTCASLLVETHNKGYGCATHGCSTYNHWAILVIEYPMVFLSSTEYYNNRTMAELKEMFNVNSIQAAKNKKWLCMNYLVR